MDGQKQDEYEAQMLFALRAKISVYLNNKLHPDCCPTHWQVGSICNFFQAFKMFFKKSFKSPVQRNMVTSS